MIEDYVHTCIYISKMYEADLLSFSRDCILIIIKFMFSDIHCQLNRSPVQNSYTIDQQPNRLLSIKLPK